MDTQENCKPEKTVEELLKSETLKHVDTIQVFKGPLKYAKTEVIRDTIKSVDETIQELKTWLRKGIAPDKTRMIANDSWQWYQNFYQGTIAADKANESLTEGTAVDYYYWTCPYFSHIGEIKLVMMHSQVNFPDGTHMPADRLGEDIKNSKNIKLMSEKRHDVIKKQDEEFVAAAMDPGANRGHPLRREGLYTKFFYRSPFFKNDTFVKGPTKVFLRST